MSVFRPSDPWLNQLAWLQTSRRRYPTTTCEHRSHWLPLRPPTSSWPQYALMHAHTSMPPSTETDTVNPKKKSYLSRWPLHEMKGDVLYRIFLDRQGRPKTHQLLHANCVISCLGMSFRTNWISYGHSEDWWSSLPTRLLRRLAWSSSTLLQSVSGMCVVSSSCVSETVSSSAYGCRSPRGNDIHRSHGTAPTAKKDQPSLYLNSGWSLYQIGWGLALTI